MKRLLSVMIAALFAVQLSAQIMPDKQPAYRFASEQELKLIKSADIWHDVALTSTVFAGCSASVSLIFFIEKEEANIREYDTEDEKICIYSAALAGAAALFATVAFTRSHKLKRKLPNNVYILKTSPRGLVIEF